jgi:hypothetical protein
LPSAYARRRYTSLVILVVILAGAFSLLAFSPTGRTTAPSPALTSYLVATGSGESVAGGLQGVFVTYNNTFSQPITAVVYFSLQSSTGQTVDVSSLTLEVLAGQNATATFAFSGMSPGMYVARVFATSSGGVPLSATTSVSVTVS